MLRVRRCCRRRRRAQLHAADESFAFRAVAAPPQLAVDAVLPQFSLRERVAPDEKLGRLPMNGVSAETL